MEHVASIMDTLSNVSGSPDTHLYPVDVQSIVKIIPELIDILRDNIGSRNLTKIFLETVLTFFLFLIELVTSTVQQL